MVDPVEKELNDLREENRILRDSLTETLPTEPQSAGDALEKTVRDISGAIGATAARAKTIIKPGSDKLTEYLSRQMEKNPAPLMLAAMGAGFLVSRRLRKKR